MSPRRENNQDLSSGANHPTPTVVKTEAEEKVSGEITDSVGPVTNTPSFVANEQLDKKASIKEPEKRLGEADIWEKTEMEKIKERYIFLT